MFERQKIDPGGQQSDLGGQDEPTRRSIENVFACWARPGGMRTTGKQSLT